MKYKNYGMSAFAQIPFSRFDEVMQMAELYDQDNYFEKVDLTMRGFCDRNTGLPFCLPIVEKIDAAVASDSNRDHEYLPLPGSPDFVDDAVPNFLLGENNLLQKKAFTIQSLGLTAAVRLGAEMLHKFGRTSIYLPNPSWPNHRHIFESVSTSQFPSVQTYNFLRHDLNGFDLRAMLAGLKNALEGSVVVLHATANNPSGVEPTFDQWVSISHLMKERKLFPFFVMSNQGLCSGNPDVDAAAVRMFAERGFELFVAQSFSKSFTLRGERVGALTVVLSDPGVCNNVKSAMIHISCPLWSNCPKYAARIVSTILRDPDFKRQWLSDLSALVRQSKTTCLELAKRLFELGAPQNSLDRLARQQGSMYYTGFNRDQLQQIRSECHVYTQADGSINLFAITTSNLKHVAEAFHIAVSNAAAAV